MLKSTHSYKTIRNVFQTLFALCALTFMVSLNANAADNKTKITYGYPEQSIFIATVNGKEQPITPMLSVAEQLFEKADISWEGSAYPAKRLFKNLKNGETNFTILVRASSLVEKFIFSQEPIYSTSLNVYSLGDKKSIASKEDLAGTRLVTIRGYSYGKLRKFINDPKNNITIEVANTHSSALRMLALGRADYLVDYASATEDLLSQNPIANLKSDKLSELNIYLVLSKAYPNANEVMTKLETIMETIDVSEIIRSSSK